MDFGGRVLRTVGSGRGAAATSAASLRVAIDPQGRVFVATTSNSACCLRAPARLNVQAAGVTTARPGSSLPARDRSDATGGRTHEQGQRPDRVVNALAGCCARGGSRAAARGSSTPRSASAWTPTACAPSRTRSTGASSCCTRTARSPRAGAPPPPVPRSCAPRSPSPSTTRATPTCSTSAAGGSSSSPARPACRRARSPRRAPGPDSCSRRRRSQSPTAWSPSPTPATPDRALHDRRRLPSARGRTPARCAASP